MWSKKAANNMNDSASKTSVRDDHLRRWAWPRSLILYKLNMIATSFGESVYEKQDLLFIEIFRQQITGNSNQYFRKVCGSTAGLRNQISVLWGNVSGKKKTVNSFVTFAVGILSKYMSSVTHFSKGTIMDSILLKISGKIYISSFKILYIFI